MNINYANSRLIELVYLNFGATAFGRLLPGCAVTRLEGHESSKHWQARKSKMALLAYPSENRTSAFAVSYGLGGSRIMRAAGQDGLIALNGFVNDRLGAGLLFPDGGFTFLPLEEAPQSDLVRVDFSEETRTVVLTYKYFRTTDIDRKVIEGGYLTRFLRWDDHRHLTVTGSVPGWCAFVSADLALIADEAGAAFTYDIAADRQSRGVSAVRAALESQFQQTLAEPEVPSAEIPGVLRMRGDEAGFKGPRFSAIRAVSSSARALFETDLAKYMPEDITLLTLDPAKEYWIDGVYVTGRGFVCTFKRMSSSPLNGFQFTNAEGTAFRFLSTGHFSMGFVGNSLFGGVRPRYIGDGIKLVSYPAGIYQVDMTRGTVRHTPQPSRTGGVVRAGSYEEEQLDHGSISAAYFLMRRGNA